MSYAVIDSLEPVMLRGASSLLPRAESHGMFTRAQAQWICSLYGMSKFDFSLALDMLWEYAPGRFSKNQALLVEEFLGLDELDMRTALAGRTSP